MADGNGNSATVSADFALICVCNAVSSVDATGGGIITKGKDGGVLDFSISH